MASGMEKNIADIAEKALKHISGTKTDSGDNELVAAPGSDYRLVVTSFVIQNETGNATTMILKSGSSNCWRLRGQNQGDGLSRDFSIGREWRLAENEALNINLSAANSCGYSVAYFTERAQ